MLTASQGAIGLRLRFRVTDGTGKAYDLTPFVGETVEVLAAPPSGATRTWTAAIDGDPPNGEILYTTEEGDLDQFGLWEIQAHVLKAGATGADPPELEGRSSIVRLRVDGRLDA